MENSQNIVLAGRQSPQHVDQIDARGKMVVSTVTDLSGFIAFNLLHTSDFNVWLGLRAMKLKQLVLVVAVVCLFLSKLLFKIRWVTM